MSSRKMHLLQELFTAVETGNVEEVELILRTSKAHDEGNFDVNQRLLPMHDMTPLHLAVGLNSRSIVNLLLAYGADPNCLNCGETVSPLHLSVLYDLESMVQILLESGGDPKLPDGENKSCFDLAVENEVTHLIEKLDLRGNKFDDTETFERNEAEILREVSLETPSVPIATQCPPSTDTHKLASDPESFYSCFSKAMKTPASSILTSDDGTDKLSTTTTSQPSSHEVWSPGYSYLMTEDDTTSTCKSVSGTDADKSSDTTVLEESASCTSTTSFVTPLAHPRTKVPTPEEIKTLTAAVKDLGIRVPVTQSTFPFLTQHVENSSNGNGNGNVASSAASCPEPVPKPTAQERVAAAIAALALSDPEKRPISPPKSGFSPELQASLSNLDLIHSWGNLKIDLIQSLTPTKKTSKSFYNYVLLDPKIIKRANFSGNHLKSEIIKNTEKFETFLSAVFYVGKGCGNRPIAHLVDAKIQLLQTKRTTTGKSEKLGKIVQIWKSGQGVILHSAFHHSAEREANINEAAIIDAIGGSDNPELTNLKKGSYLGTGAVEWTQKMKNQFGSFLLYKCFCGFVVSDAKAFFPHDV